MDARTLEQVILDLARKNWSAFVDKPAAAAEIADAVRKWMLDTPGAVFHDRIKELEAEVERLKLWQMIMNTIWWLDSMTEEE